MQLQSTFFSDYIVGKVLNKIVNWLSVKLRQRSESVFWLGKYSCMHRHNLHKYVTPSPSMYANQHALENAIALKLQATWNKKQGMGAASRRWHNA